MKFKPKKLLNWILGLAIGWVLTIGGASSVKDYLLFSSKEEIALSEKLTKEGGTAIATYNLDKSEDNSYSVKGIPVVSLKLFYAFEVAGVGYEGFQETNKVPTRGMVRVTYLTDDPGQNMIDPQANLIKLKELRKSGRYLWFGLGAVVLGLIILFFKFRDLKDIKNEISNRRSDAKEESLKPSTKTSALETKEQVQLSSERSDKLDVKEKPSKIDRLEKRREAEPKKESSVINKEELSMRSQKEFKQTDHNRFMPPKKSSNSEEE